MNKQQIIAKLIQLQGEVEDLAGLLEDTGSEQGDDVHSAIEELWDTGSMLNNVIDLLGGETKSQGPGDGIPYVLLV